ncbi:MAG: DUF6263 family protein [Planctomycetaceae bacterium]
MRIQYACRWFCLALLAGGLVGCNYFQGSASDLDDEFADLELDDTPAVTGGLPRKSESLGRDRERQDEERAPLRLAVGDQFPLIKTVEQKLTLPGPQGVTVGQTRLETQLSLTVEEIRDGATRFGVRYHGVHYQEQDLAGHRCEFSSSQAGAEIPPQASAYAALVNNGFSFWVGPDNQLIELVGYPDFLKRCMQHLPVAQRQAMIAQMSAEQADQGIASFVDESIGILPVNRPGEEAVVPIRKGSSWVLPVRHIDGPIPMQVSTHCLIKDLTDETVQIDLFGTIMPVAGADSSPSGKCSVRGGRCLGNCTVDRQTGLPTASRVERYLDIVLQSPDGQQLEQQKEIITTIRALPGSGQAYSGTQSSVMPAHHAEITQDVGGGVTPASQAPRRSADDLRLFR